jgi:cell division protein FtsI (penicillin-binding protein 3)
MAPPPIQQSQPIATELAPLGAPARNFSGWSLVLAASVTAAMLAVVGRVTQVQLYPSEDLSRHIVARVGTKKELPLRGDILDRRGRLLAATRTAERVIADPTLIKDLDTTAVALGKALGVPAEEIATKILWAKHENIARQAALDARAATGANEGTNAGEDVSESLELLNVTEPPTDAAAALERFQNVSKYPTSPDYDITLEPKRLIRYITLSDLLTTQQAAAVREALRPPQRGEARVKIIGVTLETQSVREFVGGREVANIVGLYGWEGKNKTGVEARKDALLHGQPGKISYVRDGKGNPLYSTPQQVQRATAGDDLRLSFDLEVQRIIIDEVETGLEDCDAQGGRAVVLDVRTGEVLGMAEAYRPISGLAPLPQATPEERANRRKMLARAAQVRESRTRYQIVTPDVTPDGKPKLPGLGRNRCVEDVYEPGSTFKPFMWASLLEAGHVGLNQVIDTEGGTWITPTGRPISDVTQAQSMTWREVLINSSNIGMIKGLREYPKDKYRAAITRFGFGSRTRIGLPGESGGIVTSLKDWSIYTHTSMSYGNEVGVTAIQMARAFCVFARDGELAGTLPSVRITTPTAEELQSEVIFRVLPGKTALITRDVMTNITASMQRKYAQSAPDGSPWKYNMFGKSGTARPPVPPFGYLQHQYVPSFISASPTEAPRIVVLVVIDDPGPKRIATRTYYGASTAGPINRRITERVLTYLGVPPSPVPLGPDGKAIATTGALPVDAVPME